MLPYFRTLLICFFALQMQAQRSNTEVIEYGIIYLENGSVLVGELASKTDQKIGIQFLDQVIINVDRNKIARLLDNSQAIVYKNGMYHDIKEFFWGFNYGFNGASLVKEETLISTHFEPLFGWRFGKRLSVAHSIGFEFNESEISGFRIDTQFASAYLYLKYFFTDQKLRLFGYSRLGYGFVGEENNINQDHTGGGQLQLGAGIQLPSKRRIKWAFSAALHLQKTEGSESFIDGLGNEILTEYDILIARPILKLGFEFN